MTEVVKRVLGMTGEAHDDPELELSKKKQRGMRMGSFPYCFYAQDWALFTQYSLMSSAKLVRFPTSSHDRSDKL